jgi:ribosomal protein L32
MFLDVSPFVLGASTLKRCSKCGEYKLRDQFSKYTKSPDGLYSSCKLCVREYHRRYYEANGERVREHVAQYREQNSETVKERKRVYAQENAERVRQQRRVYREKNADAIRERKRRYYVANAEQLKEKARQWRLDNPERAAETAHQNYQKRAEETRARQRLWYINNPDKVRVQRHARRMRKTNSGNCTPAELNAIRAAQTDKRGRLRCWWCGKPITQTPHLDHKIALARGGSNDAANLCYSCPRCNRSKGTKSPADFAGRLL